MTRCQRIWVGLVGEEVTDICTHVSRILAVQAGGQRKQVLTLRRNTRISSKNLWLVNWAQLTVAGRGLSHTQCFSAKHRLSR